MKNYSQIKKIISQIFIGIGFSIITLLITISLVLLIKEKSFAENYFSEGICMICISIATVILMAITLYLSYKSSKKQIHSFEEGFREQARIFNEGFRTQAEIFNNGFAEQRQTFVSSTDEIVNGLSNVVTKQEETSDKQANTFTENVAIILKELTDFSKNQQAISQKQIESFENQSKEIINGFKSVSENQKDTLDVFKEQTNHILNDLQIISQNQSNMSEHINIQTKLLLKGMEAIFTVQQEIVKSIQQLNTLTESNVKRLESSTKAISDGFQKTQEEVKKNKPVITKITDGAKNFLNKINPFK